MKTLQIDENEEKVLRVVLSKKEDSLHHFNLCTADYSTYPEIEPNEFVNIIFRLYKAGALTGLTFCGPKDEQHNCYFDITNEGRKYFDMKAVATKQKWFSGAIDFFKFLIPTIISILALLVSIFKE